MPTKTAKKKSKTGTSKSGFKMKKLWGEGQKKGRELGGELIPVDPGQYDFQIVGIEKKDFGKDKGKKLIQKFAVINNEDEELIGKVCTNFRRYDRADDLAWIYNELAMYGIDADDLDIDTDDDLVAVYQQLIDEGVVAMGQVTENGQYLNMRLKHTIEVDTDYLLDPKAVIKGELKGWDGEPIETSGEGGGDDEEVEEEEAEAFAENDIVKFKNRGKILQGKIIGWDSETEDPIVKVGPKTYSPKFDAIELVAKGEAEEEAEEEEAEEVEEEVEEETEEEVEEEVEEEEQADPEVGDELTFTAKNGKDQMTGEVREVTDENALVRVTSKGPLKGKLIRVERDRWLDDESEEEAEEEEVEEEGDAVFEVGDKVVFEYNGKPKEGEVRKIDGDVLKVKMQGKRGFIDVDRVDASYKTDA